jgi:DNA modification methylase
MNIRNRVKALRNVRAADLTPNPKNWRTHPKTQKDALRGILAEVGYADALLARELPDGSLMLVDGHLRAETTPEQEVPVLVLDINEAEADKLLLSLDPLAALAETNAVALDSLLREVDTGSEGLQQMYADLAEAAELYEGDNAEIVEDEIPEPPVDPITKPGDIWILGEHRLLCGDSTKAEDVGRLMAGAKADMMVTDPPYGVEYDADWRNQAKRPDGTAYGASALGKVSNDDRADWRESWALFHGDIAYVWHAGCRSPEVAESLTVCDFVIRNLIVWAKNSMVIGRGDYHHQHEPCWYVVRKGCPGRRTDDRTQTTLWQIDKPQKSETGHSTQKPVECMARPMRNHEAELIYDPFLGSGTTLIAAEQLGRKCYGMEISPQYCDVIVKRWETLTGKKAELEASNGQARPAQRADDPEDRQRQPRQKAAEQKRAKAARR